MQGRRPSAWDAYRCNLDIPLIYQLFYLLLKSVSLGRFSPANEQKLNSSSDFVRPGFKSSFVFVLWTPAEFRIAAYSVFAYTAYSIGVYVPTVRSVPEFASIVWKLCQISA